MIPYEGDLFQSKRGKGPQLMRVVHIIGERVHCVHLRRNRAQDTLVDSRMFSLPMWFFASESCGWALADHQPPASEH